MASFHSTSGEVECPLMFQVNNCAWEWLSADWNWARPVLVGSCIRAFPKARISISAEGKTGERAGLTLFVRTNSSRSWQFLDLLVLTRMEYEGMWKCLYWSQSWLLLYSSVYEVTPPTFLRAEEKPFYRRGCTITWSPSLEELEEWNMSLKKSGACLGSPAYPLS